MNTAILLFIICTLANVVIATIKSVMTIKGGKVAASIWNALSYGLYSYIVIMTANADISTLGKVLITVGCNLIGVFFVKLVEEKMRKDRLWKIEMTIYSTNADKMHQELENAGIPNNYVIAGRHAIFNCYCDTQSDSANALAIGKTYNAKTFASETKLNP